MFLQLGTYKFEGIKLPQSWNGSFETVYAQIPIINGKPVVQKTGEKLVEFEIQALFSDEFCVPIDEVSALQLYRRNGNVLQLTGGDGVNYGRYVITSISIVNSRAFADGYVSQIQANLKLLEYNTTSTVIKQSGLALSNQKPVPEEPLTPLVSRPASLHNDIQAGTLKAQEVDAESKKSTVNYKKISQLADDATTSWNQADNKIQNTVKIASRASNLHTSLASAMATMASIKTAAQNRDPVAFYNSNAAMSNNIHNLKGASAPIASFMGSKEGGN